MRQVSKHGASMVAQMVKNPAAMQETWVQSLGQQDSLPKGMEDQGNGNQLQYPYLGSSIDSGALWARVHEVSKSWTQLSN